MFAGRESNVVSFNSEMPSLINAHQMFASDRRLRTFSTPSGKLHNSLKDTSYMFHSCYGLTEWTVELPNSLTNAEGMFYDCSGLTSFQSNMPSGLTGADMMFFGCKLDKDSL